MAGWIDRCAMDWVDVDTGQCKQMPGYSATRTATGPLLTFRVFTTPPPYPSLPFPTIFRREIAFRGCRMKQTNQPQNRTKNRKKRGKIHTKNVRECWAGCRNSTEKINKKLQKKKKI